MKKSNLLHDYYASNSIDGLKYKTLTWNNNWLWRLLEWFNIVDISNQYRLSEVYIYGK